VLLDLTLPEMSGTDVCRQMRKRSHVPIIMVTSRDSEIDKVVGLEIGADDYVTKPYSPRELVAGIRAVLRRQVGDASGGLSPATLAAGPARMDVDRHVVIVNGGSVQLPLKEFEVLELLLRNAGRVLTRGQLIDRVWGADYVGDTKTLDVYVKRLRSKIEPEPSPPHRYRPRPRLQVRALTPGRRLHRDRDDPPMAGRRTGEHRAGCPAGIGSDRRRCRRIRRTDNSSFTDKIRCASENVPPIFSTFIIQANNRTNLLGALTNLPS
jgi:two-component system response regulator RegX3